MKNLYFLIVILFIFNSCKKTDAVTAGNLASLNIINLLPNSEPLITVTSTTGPPYSAVVGYPAVYGVFQNFGGIGSVGYGSAALFSLTAGNDTVYLVQNNSDTLLIGGKIAKVMYSGVLNLSLSNSYSLFITGADTSAPDYVFVHNSLPSHPYTGPDSTFALRFINLSAGSSPISINVQGQSNGSEAANLSYKGATSFKNYSGGAAVDSYTFVFRDAATGDSLTQYTLSGVNYGIGNDFNNNTVLFQNMTIAFTGPANAPQAILINPPTL